MYLGNNGKKLRPVQVEAIAQLRFSLAKGNMRPICQAPTGFGKTTLASAIINSALEKGKRVMFVVPALSLIDQTVESFWNDGIRQVGVIQGSHELTDYAKPVQIASVQTLMRRKNLPHADLVLIDEAHRWFSFYEKWFADWALIPFVGLSATPWTKGLGKHYDDLLIAATTKEMIDQGYLSPFEVYGPSNPDLSKVRTVAGDYHEGDLSDVMSDQTLVADVVSTWQKLGQNRPTLCFGVDRAHAKKLAASFESAGIATAYIDAYTDSDERNRIGKLFNSGEIKIVCNVGCLTTGVDWDVRCIILARPTKSEILFTQIIGRGLRLAEGKENCLILDHSTTHQRLGFVTDIHHEALDDGKQKKSKQKERQEPLPKACSKCSFIKPAKVHQCPSCGFLPEKQSGITEEAGELKKLKPKKRASKGEKQEFYSGLRTYAVQKGFNPGWISHTYKDYFGVWPKDLKQTYGPVTEEVIGFIRHKQIKYAKRRNAA